MNTSSPATIDAYLADFPADIQQKLTAMRTTIQQAAPGATEAIKYGMPTFVLHGNLVYFAAFKHHIGFYATPNGNKEFAAELAGYKTGNGSIQFPLDQPLPLDLVARMVRFRVQENTAKMLAKKKK